MKKLYLIVPIICLIAFAFYYSSYREEARALQEERQRQVAEAEAQAAREKAEYQARVAREAREAAAEKARIAAERYAQEQREKEEWESLNKELERVTLERDKVAQQSFDLSSALRDEEDLLYRATTRLQSIQEEQKFLLEYMPSVSANRKSLQTFLEEVEAARTASLAASAQSATSTKR